MSLEMGGGVEKSRDLVGIFQSSQITVPWNIQQCNEYSTVCLVVGSHQRIPSRPRSNDTAHRPWMETWVVLRVVWEGTWFVVLGPWWFDRPVVVGTARVVPSCYYFCCWSMVMMGAGRCRGIDMWLGILCMQTVDLYNNLVRRLSREGKDDGTIAVEFRNECKMVEKLSTVEQT